MDGLCKTAGPKETHPFGGRAEAAVEFRRVRGDPPEMPCQLNDRMDFLIIPAQSWICSSVITSGGANLIISP